MTPVSITRPTGQTLYAFPYLMFWLIAGDWDHCRKCYDKQRDEGIYEI